MPSFTIAPATPGHADAIVRLIMMAMSADCCLYFAGPGHTLDDFARVLRRLVLIDESQYSYRNTLVALTPQGTVVGICTAYDGALLHRLRQAFIRTCRDELGREFERFADETAPGEFYVDSLAVEPACRRQGIASALLLATARKAAALALPLGLLVDAGNPTAERLYTSLGFRYAGQNVWGGHPMKHLLLPTDKKEWGPAPF